MLDRVVDASHSWAVPAQSLDPALFVDAAGPTRAAVSFALTVVVAGWLVYAYGGRLDRAARTSLSRPLSSVLYGFVAFVLVGFVVAYGSTVLSTVGVDATVIGVLGAVTVVGVVLALSGLGFAVVGVWIAGALGLRDPLLGAVVWSAVVVVGIGGPTRAWVHRDAVAVQRR
jgi:hypothetical protein